MKGRNDSVKRNRSLPLLVASCLAAAQLFLSPAIAATPSTDSYALIRAGYQQLCQGNNEGAIDTFNAALRINPTSVDARRYLAYALMQSGLAAQAVPQFEYVNKMAPASAKDLALLGDAYFYCGQYQKAEHCYQQSLALDADLDKARAGLVHTYVAAGDTTHASQICQQGLQRAKTLASRSEYESLMRDVHVDAQPPVLSE